MFPEGLLGTRFIKPPPPDATLFPGSVPEDGLTCVDVPLPIMRSKFWALLHFPFKPVCGPLVQWNSEFVKAWGPLQPKCARSARV
eukprot:1445340-Pyramimonas_sp.AAC.1